MYRVYHKVWAVQAISYGQCPKFITALIRQRETRSTIGLQKRSVEEYVMSKTRSNTSCWNITEYSWHQRVSQRSSTKPEIKHSISYVKLYQEISITNPAITNKISRCTSRSTIIHLFCYIFRVIGVPAIRCSTTWTLIFSNTLPESLTYQQYAAVRRD